MEKEILNEKQDSIGVSKNSRGYTWDIKLYYDNEDTKPEDIIKRLKLIDETMKQMFKDKE